MRRITSLVLTIGLAVTAATSHAQDTAETKKPDISPQQQKLNALFEEKMSGVRLVGSFTILGKDDALKKEAYEIKKVSKLPDGDYWLFQTRIVYGNKDVTLPLPLEVKWADTTPVITLTNVAIPGLGTFSSRVLIYKDKYAGTWTHGEVGGHLFGTIEKIAADQEEK